MKPPIKDIPAAINRRFDDLERKTSGEGLVEVIKTVIPGTVRVAPGGAVAPPTVILEGVTAESISLSAAPDDADLYEFALRIVGTDGWNTLVTTGNTATFISLAPRTQYEAKVRLLNTAGGSGSWSSTITIMTDEDRLPPPVPEDLDLVADGYYIRAKVTDIPISDFPDLAGFEFHASLETGFEPDDDTLKQVGISNRAIIHVTEAGQTWYVVARSFDRNRNYSEYCTEVSILIPSTKIPTSSVDPTVEGEVNIVEGSLAIDNCDTIGDWESEQTDAIRIEAADLGDVVEGTGAIKVEIDQYSRKINQDTGTNTLNLGAAAAFQYLGQRFKAPWTGNCKRISVPLSKVGNPVAAVLYVYSDDNGNPATWLGALGSATLTAPSEGTGYTATFAAAFGLVDGTPYWIIIESTVDAANYWHASYSQNNPYEGVDYMMGRGGAPAVASRYPDFDIVFRLFDDTDCTGKHFKISSLAAKDLSEYDTIEFQAKRNTGVTGATIKASMGEAALGEQTYALSGLSTTYSTHVWDISAVTPTAIDAIDNFGIEVDVPANFTLELFFDNFRGVKVKKVNVKASDEILQLYPCAHKGRRMDWPNWEAEEIAWDSGWFAPSANIASRERHTHGLGFEPDFVFLWTHGVLDVGMEVFCAQWDFHGSLIGHRIVGPPAMTTYIDTHAYSNRIYSQFYDPGAEAVYGNIAKYRLLAIKKAPDYDSDWIAMTALSTQVTKAHGLATVPDFYTLEVAHPTIGRGFSMMGAINYSGNYPTVICDVDGTNIVFSVGNVQICQFYDYTNTIRSITSPTGWFYRIKAWSWTPSYTSAWTAISTTDKLQLFKHDLGEIPYLYLIEFSKAADGSNDVVPLMSTSVYNVDPYGYGTHLLSPGHKYASIMSGHASTVHYEDSGGALQALTEGYVRLKLWI